MTTTDHLPDVTTFVAEVRARLADLNDDQRDELLDGLEADLAEQLADGANGVLADPAAYAAELRVAAGLPAAASRGRWVAGRGLVGALDGARHRWDGAVSRSAATGQAWAFAVLLRPVWWVLRAWVAVSLLDDVVGRGEPVGLLPTMVVPGLGMAALALAVVGSVLLGQGRLGLGGRARGGLFRVALAVLNLVAVVGLLYLVQHSTSDREQLLFSSGDAVAVAPRGVVVDGRSVRNIYPYDAQGQPITTGVQLFDGAGRPIALSADQAARLDTFRTGPGLVGCPWVNGTQRLFNVFPLPERTQRQNTTCEERLDAQLGTGQLPTPPLAEVPPAALPSPSAP